MLWGGVGSVFVLSLVLFLIFGLDSSGGSSGAGGAISIRPAEAVLGAGDSLTLVATGEGGAARGSGVRWVSQNPEIARVIESGRVVGGRVGAASVLAILDGDTAQATVRVTPGPPARIALAPASLRLVSGASEQLSASVTDAQDNLILEERLQWSSSVPEVAEVDGSGVVRARSPGSSVIRAEAGGAWNQAAVEVVASSPEPRPREPDTPTCPDPVMDRLDRLEVAMDDPSASREELRAGALACWNRGQALSSEERAYAAWLIGLNTVNMEGCTQAAILWLDRAVQLEPGSEAYRVAREACGGGQP